MIQVVKVHELEPGDYIIFKTPEELDAVGEVLGKHGYLDSNGAVFGTGHDCREFEDRNMLYVAHGRKILTSPSEFQPGPGPGTRQVELKIEEVATTITSRILKLVERLLAKLERGIDKLLDKQ